MTDSGYDSRMNSMGCPRPSPSMKKDCRRGRLPRHIVGLSANEPLPDADSVPMLQKENTSLKLSVQAIKILKPLLKDRDKLINALEQKEKEYKICIEHLQSRLHRHKLDSSVELKEHELFVPGHDKEVLNDLLKEIIRLRKIIDANYNSEEVAEAQKTVEELRSEVSRLNKELRVKEKEFTDHLEAMKSSDSDKDALICKLTHDLRQYYHQRSYDDEIRSTLSGEVGQMKLKIEILVSEMGNMAKELKVYEKREKEMAEEKKIMDKHSFLMRSEDSGLSLKDECRSLQEQTVNLSRENTDLAKQLKDVISMNTRWQKYSDQREAYVIQLTEKNKFVSSQKTVLESNQQELHQKLGKLEKRLEQKEIEHKDSVDAAVLSLEADLERFQEYNSKLQNKIAKLEKECRQQRAPSPEDSERIMLLEHQVKSLTEDFNLERKDRTDLQGRYQQVVDKNNELSDIIVRLQNEARTSRTQQQQQQQLRFDPLKMESRCGFNYAAANQQQYFTQEQVEVDGPGGQDLIDFDIPDTSQDRKTHSPIERLGDAQVGGELVGTHGGDNADGSLEEDEQPLRCPRCFRGFKVMEHAMLVEHVDTCDGQDDIEIG